MNLKWNAHYAILAAGNLTNGNGTGKQVVGAGNISTAVLVIGAGGGSGAIKVQESDTLGGDYTDCLQPGSEAVASIAVAAGDASSVKDVAFYRTKPFLRAVTSGVSGTAPGTLLVVTQKQVVARPGEAGISQLFDAHPDL